MKIDIVTIFPGFFDSPLSTSIVARAVEAGHVSIDLHDLRSYTEDRHRTVDDAPFGGGGGMVMKPEPVAAAWESLDLQRGHCIYLTADGTPLKQERCKQLSLEKHLVLLCGHYKGIDERIKQVAVDEEISIGDYVVTGGEPAALVLLDAVVRLVPGVLGNFSSALEDSFHEDLLDCPWYTRPAKFGGRSVPEVLLNGDHEQVRIWRREQALRRTYERRPELLTGVELDDDERRLVDRWKQQEEASSAFERDGT